MVNSQACPSNTWLTDHDARIDGDPIEQFLFSHHAHSGANALRLREATSAVRLGKMVAPGACSMGV
jgi:hypothetical protein